MSEVREARESFERLAAVIGRFGITFEEAQEAAVQFAKLLEECEAAVLYLEELEAVAEAEAELRLFLQTAAWVVPVFILATAFLAVIAS